MAKATGKMTGGKTPASPLEGEDWRAAALEKVRVLIKQADPGVSEVRKWAKASNHMQGVPVWEHDGIICTGETYKDKIKLTFAHGAKLADPAGVFNAGLDGGTRRAIDVRQGETVNAAAFKALVKAAVAFNTAKARKPKKG